MPAASAAPNRRLSALFDVSGSSKPRAVVGPFRQRPGGWGCGITICSCIEGDDRMDLCGRIVRRHWCPPQGRETCKISLILRRCNVSLALA